MNNLDVVREMISRGLDADLDRKGIRHLFLMVARDEEVRKEMEEMAALEEALSILAQKSVQHAAVPELSDHVIATLRAAPEHTSRAGFVNFPGRRFFVRLREMSAWQTSIAAGLVTATLAWLVVMPFWGHGGHGSENTRLVVHDLQFIDAQPRVTWTNQFIVPPGGETRFVLQLGADKPLRIQFQTAEPSPVRVVHDAPGSVRGSVSLFTVDGIGYATLRRPRTGDGVMIHNQGPVPLVVYLQGVGSDGTLFSHSPMDQQQKRQSL
ncbi:MAG: hypothetical protein HQL64_14545 [Magnetococcales bacterium]|nr:hypothetical protein [Magnetococcales bacterium]